MKRLLVFVLVAGGIWLYQSRPATPVVRAAPPDAGVQALSTDEAPIQRDPQRPVAFEVNGYEVRTLQAFALKARVLSVEHYRADREADLAPTDIAFGWGRMADPGMGEALSISQGGRWYFWRYAGTAPLPAAEIVASSANMHLIPANDQVARALRELDKGAIVSLRGYLVEVRAKDGWRWRSSLSRHDTGAGSCEVVFVQALDAH
jgi:hypothetical protein